MKPEIAATFAHKTFFTVALDLSMADPAWMNGRRIRILRVKNHWLIGWINLAGHSRWTHHWTTWHTRTSHSWWSVLWMVRVHLWIAVWGHHAMRVVGWKHVRSGTALHHVWGHHVSWTHGGSIHAWSIGSTLHVRGHHAWLVLTWWTELTWWALHTVRAMGTWRSRRSTLHLVVRRHHTITTGAHDTSLIHLVLDIMDHIVWRWSTLLLSWMRRDPGAWWVRPWAWTHHWLLWMR